MKDKLERLSVQMIEEYYCNDPTLFFDNADDDFIWVGPTINQYIEGKKALLEAWGNEQNTLTFHITQMSSRSVSGGVAACEVLLKYVVYTYYPSGHISMHHQRVTLFWKRIKSGKPAQWKCSLMHVSNGMESDSRDNIYPLHLDEFEAKQPYTIFDTLTHQRQERLIANGTNGTTYYIEYADIQYICAGKGKFCDIHTRNGVICVRLLIDQLQHLLPHQFCRPHRSYLVNVMEITSLSRSQITLRNGACIPVPAKKYRQVEADIAAHLKELA